MYIKNINCMYDYIFKYIIVGNSGCGKSSIASSFCNNSYSLDHNVTIGVDFLMKIIDIYDKKIKIQIWDTAGQEIFRSITKSYYKNTCVAIVVYDITNRDSFHNISNWVQDIKELNPNIPKIIIIGNKSDMNYHRKVSTKEGEDFCKLHNFIFYETSIKKEHSIKDIFYNSSKEICDDIQNHNIEIHKTNGITKISIPKNTIQIDKEEYSSKKCLPCI